MTHMRDPKLNAEKRMSRTQRNPNPQKQETIKEEPDIPRKDPKRAHNPQPKKLQQEKK